MTRADWVVLASAVLLVSAFYQYFWSPGRYGAQAEIRVDGEYRGVVSLDENRTHWIDGRAGPSILEVRDHKVRFSQSACGGKNCIRSGWAENAGDILACLPNRVSVRVLGGDPRFDAINF